MKFSSIEGLTFSCLRYLIFTSQTFRNNEETREGNYRETQLESNEETRKTKLESREQSYGGAKLESNEKKLENKVAEKRS